MLHSISGCAFDSVCDLLHLGFDDFHYEIFLWSLNVIVTVKIDYANAFHLIGCLRKGQTIVVPGYTVQFPDEMLLFVSPYRVELGHSFVLRTCVSDSNILAPKGTVYQVFPAKHSMCCAPDAGFCYIPALCLGCARDSGKIQ